MAGRVVITITHDPAYRRSLWDETSSSRPGWLVSCPDHPSLGKCSDGEPWGYAKHGIARNVATRHGRQKHGDHYQIVEQTAESRGDAVQKSARRIP